MGLVINATYDSSITTSALASQIEGERSVVGRHRWNEIIPDVRVVAEAMDRDLKVMEDVKVRLHLRKCPCCAEFVKQMDVMRMAMRRIGR